VGLIGLNMENKSNKSFIRRVPWWGWLLIILFAPGFLMSLFSAGKSEPISEPTKQEEVKKENKQTQASVNFTGTQFIITNKNDFDWNRVEIIVNEKYRYEAGVMKSGSTYEIGAGQFTDKKNVRFNPFEIKPAEIRIYVKEPMSDDWYGELK
jgi:hypothetical protein